MLLGLSTNKAEMQRVRCLLGSTESEDSLRRKIIRAKVDRYLEQIPDGWDASEEDDYLFEAIASYGTLINARPKVVERMREYTQDPRYRNNETYYYLQQPESVRAALEFEVAPPSLGPWEPTLEGEWGCLSSNVLTEISLYGVDIWRDMGLVCRRWYSLRASYADLFLAQFIPTKSTANPGDPGYPDYVELEEEPVPVLRVSPSFSLGVRSFYADIPPELSHIPLMITTYTLSNPTQVIVNIDFTSGDSSTLDLQPSGDGSFKVRVDPIGCGYVPRTRGTRYVPQVSVQDPVGDISYFFYQRRITGLGPFKVRPSLLEILSALDVYEEAPQHILEAARCLKEEPASDLGSWGVPDELTFDTEVETLDEALHQILPHHVYARVYARDPLLANFNEFIDAAGLLPLLEVVTVIPSTRELEHTFYRDPESWTWRYIGPRPLVG